MRAGRMSRSGIHCLVRSLWKSLSSVRESIFRMTPADPLAYLALLAILTMTALLLIRYWSAFDSPAAPFGAYEEQFLEFNYATNFAEKGFLRLRFLPDASVDLAGPPIYYTHFPPLASVIAGLLMKVGLTSLPALRLVMIGLSLTGFAAVFLFARSQLGSLAAVTVVLALVVNRDQVLVWSDHLVYAYWYAPSFVAFWALTSVTSRRRLGLGMVLLISLISYIQLLITLSTLALLALARVRQIAPRALVSVMLVASAGVGLHLIQDAVALGPSIAVQDTVNTLLNRTIGTPSRDALLEFSRDHDIVLWGASGPSNPISSSAWYVDILFAKWRLVLPAYLLLVWLAWSGSVPARRGLRLAVSFTIASLTWHLVFPAHGKVYPFPLAAAIAVALPVGAAVGAALSSWGAAELVTRMEGFARRRFWSLSAVASLGILWAALLLYIFFERLRGEASVTLRPAGLILALLVVGLLTPDLRRLVATSAPAVRKATGVAVGGAFRLRRLPVLLGVVAIGAGLIASALQAWTPPSDTVGVEELHVLSAFPGRVLWTNVTPHPAAYYTNAPVVGQMPLQALRDARPDEALVPAISERSPNWPSVLSPDAFFLSRHGIVSAIASDPTQAYEEFRKYLDGRFPILAASTTGSIVFDLRAPHPEGSSVTGVRAAEPGASQQLPLDRTKMTASSRQGDAAPAGVTSSDPDSYWHRGVVDGTSTPREIPAWLAFEFDAPTAIEVLRFRPRTGFPAQMWSFGTVLSGSDDGITWEYLRTLVLPSREENGPVTFPIGLGRPYRHYRLTFWDPTMLAIGKAEAFGPSSVQ